MTKRRVLEICRDLWLWLADNPRKCKSEWPGWKLNGGNVKECIEFCPCCEYCQYLCAECPLLNLWPRKLVGGDPCMKASSPFTKWSYAEKRKTRKKYALIIANGAIAELEKMEGSE